MDGYLSVAETAAALGVDIRTVRRWIRAKVLQAARLPGRGGGEWRIPREAVDHLLTKGVPRSGVNPLDSVPRCQATKADGTPCGGLAMRDTQFCRYHQRGDK